MGRQDGWTSPLVVAALVAGTVFVIAERRERDPMLPFRLFSSRQFSGANAMTAGE